MELRWSNEAVKGARDILLALFGRQPQLRHPQQQVGQLEREKGRAEARAMQAQGGVARLQEQVRRRGRVFATACVAAAEVRGEDPSGALERRLENFLEFCV